MARRLRRPHTREYLLGDLRDYAYVRHAEERREVFAVASFDAEDRLAAYDILHMGSITGVRVHLREVVRVALMHEAAAVVLVHNHPTGVAVASPADVDLTRRILTAMDLFEIYVADHLIVSPQGVLGMAAQYPDMFPAQAADERLAASI